MISSSLSSGLERPSVLNDGKEVLNLGFDAAQTVGLCRLGRRELFRRAEGHDRVLDACAERVAEVLFVDLGDLLIVPSAQVLENIVDGLLGGLDLLFLLDLVGDLVGEHVNEHSLEVVVG